MYIGLRAKETIMTVHRASAECQRHYLYIHVYGCNIDYLWMCCVNIDSIYVIYFVGYRSENDFLK